MNRIREFFSNLTRNQKIAMGAVGAVLVIGIAAIVIAAGGGDDKVETVATTTTTKATTTTKPAPVAPLTGLPQPDEAKRKRPALVVKIDNDNRKARPQVGLNQADIVYEEAVEGGVTRFAAVFQSTDSDPVGPVRSARSTDIQIVTQLNHPLFAWSGANGGVVAQVHAAPLTDVGFDAHPSEYFRDTSRTAPSNLFSNTTDLFALAPPDAEPPPQLFQYRKAKEKIPASAKAIRGVMLNFGGKVNYTSEWTWDAKGKGWDRNQLGTPHLDGKGTQVSPANVVVQFIQYRDSGFVDVTGAPSPEAVLTGTGKVWILTGGKRVEGTWSRPGLNSITTYKDASGKPIKLTPGRTWIVLPRDGQATVLD